MGQGSKYCLVAIGRLQVRKGSGPFSSQMRASHHKEQWPGGLRASSELAAPVFVGFPVSHSTGGRTRLGAERRTASVCPHLAKGPHRSVPTLLYFLQSRLLLTSHLFHHLGCTPRVCRTRH